MMFVDNQNTEKIKFLGFFILLCISCKDHLAGEISNLEDMNNSVHMTTDMSLSVFEDDMNFNTDLGVIDGMANHRQPCAYQLGLYTDESCEVLLDGVREFQPQYPLWSDGIGKQRFMYLPDGEQINTADQDRWIFPVGTKFWKHFMTTNGIKLETRMISKVLDLKGEAGWVFETYVWNEDGNEVTPVINGQVNVLGTDHDIPKLQDCNDCHSGGKNQRNADLSQDQLSDLALGFDAIQLNHNESDLTLSDLLEDNLLSHEISVTDAVIPGGELDRAALGYLHGNCGSCHGGAAPAKNVVMLIPIGLSDVELTPTFQSNVGQATQPGRRSTGLEDMPSTRIVVGDANNSALVWRMKQRRGNEEDNDAQMPPLASDLVDQEAVTIITRWINAL